MGNKQSSSSETSLQHQTSEVEPSSSSKSSFCISLTLEEHKIQQAYQSMVSKLKKLENTKNDPEAFTALLKAMTSDDICQRYRTTEVLELVLLRSKELFVSNKNLSPHLHYQIGLFFLWFIPLGTENYSVAEVGKEICTASFSKNSNNVTSLIVELFLKYLIPQTSPSTTNTNFFCFEPLSVISQALCRLTLNDLGSKMFTSHECYQVLLEALQNSLPSSSSSSPLIFPTHHHQLSCIHHLCVATSNINSQNKVAQKIFSTRIMANTLLHCFEALPTPMSSSASQDDKKEKGDNSSSPKTIVFELDTARYIACAICNITSDNFEGKVCFNTPQTPRIFYEVAFCKAQNSTTANHWLSSAIDNITHFENPEGKMIFSTPEAVKSLLYSMKNFSSVMTMKYFAERIIHLCDDPSNQSEAVRKLFCTHESAKVIMDCYRLVFENSKADDVIHHHQVTTRISVFEKLIGSICGLKIFLDQKNENYNISSRLAIFADAAEPTETQKEIMNAKNAKEFLLVLFQKGTKFLVPPSVANPSFYARAQQHNNKMLDSGIVQRFKSLSIILEKCEDVFGRQRNLEEDNDENDYSIGLFANWILDVQMTETLKLQKEKFADLLMLTLLPAASKSMTKSAPSSIRVLVCFYFWSCRWSVIQHATITSSIASFLLSQLFLTDDYVSDADLNSHYLTVTSPSLSVAARSTQLNSALLATERTCLIVSKIISELCATGTLYAQSTSPMNVKKYFSTEESAKAFAFARSNTRKDKTNLISAIFSIINDGMNEEGEKNFLVNYD